MRIKRIADNFISLILIAAMVFSAAALLPQEVFADSYVLEIGIEGLTATYDEESWTASGTAIAGSATGNDEDDCGAAGSLTTTLNLKNTSGERVMLSFDYGELSLAAGGSVVIDGRSVTSSGSFAKNLDIDESIDITIVSGDPGNLTSSVHLTNVSLVVDRFVETVFLPAAGCGSYTVNGTPVGEEGLVGRQDSTESYVLAASPDSGYKFMGWYSETKGRYLSSASPYTAYFDSDQKIYPVFVGENVPVWQAGSLWTAELSEALSFAQENSVPAVTLLSGGTLAAGSYTVPAGVTLLVPCDSIGTVSAGQPAIYDGIAAFSPYPFRTLTLADGAELTVRGDLNINGKINSYNSGYSGVTSGVYGYVIMKKGSHIRLKSGAHLYCWGYISGDGTIKAESGSFVYEPFQIADLRGGSATQDMNSNPQRVLAFQQYYAQNIEASLTLESGAVEDLVGSISVSGSVSRPVLPFVGMGKKCLFSLGSGSSFTKRYDKGTDRMQYTVSGDAALYPVMIEANVRIESERFVLPLMESTTISIDSGTTVINQDLFLIPGCEIIIGKKAGVTVSAGRKVYVLDLDDYAGGGFVTGNADMVPCYYQPGRTAGCAFGPEDMKDAKLDVNGKVTLEGDLFTSAEGADITSSGGTGKIIFTKAPVSESVMYQAVQTGTTISYAEIAVTAPALHNGAAGTTVDAEYTLTAGCEEGTQYSYCADEDIWHEGASCAVTDIEVVIGPGSKLIEGENVFVDGNTLTVTNNLPCKAGYLSNGRYVLLPASANGDGSYSFTADDGVDTVFLVVRGDTDLNGRVNTADSSKTQRAVLSKDTLSSIQSFAADANDDGRLNTADAGLIQRVVLRKSSFNW